MRTQKEIFRDNILAAMKPYLDAVAMDMLNQVIVQHMQPEKIQINIYLNYLWLKKRLS
ncbi:MAG: hypothetical protein MSA90_22085 [Faecalicatena sp.]|uniref:hypothetical protein n=1 Tax=Faecalicatena sp. TaxID=2005360 RepID=UPI00258BCA6A|nr:hypothetical protein [Faecalicatena sp.]MCI6468140.1 hypothetical protein [Faecalicatena sp.]MDY5620394.1 hypothetical protein [Lachnospiraceae bacterium]